MQGNDQPEECNKRKRIAAPTSNSEANNKNNEVFQATVKYQQTVQQIQSQNQLVETASKEFLEISKTIAATKNQYQEVLNIFNKQSEEMFSISLNSPSQKIFNTKTNFSSANENLKKLSLQLSDDTLKLYQKRQIFEQELGHLKEKESELKKVQDNLQNVHAEIGILSMFVSKFDSLSQKYFVPEKIQQTVKKQKIVINNLNNNNNNNTKEISWVPKKLVFQPQQQTSKPQQLPHDMQQKVLQLQKELLAVRKNKQQQKVTTQSLPDAVHSSQKKS